MGSEGSRGRWLWTNFIKMCRDSPGPPPENNIPLWCSETIRGQIRPGSSLITSIYKSEGTVHARGNKPFMLSYFPLVLCLRKNIRAVHAQHEGVVYSFVNLEISFFALLQERNGGLSMCMNNNYFKQALLHRRPSVNCNKKIAE